MKTNIDNLDRSNPFLVPEGYFSGLEKSIILKTTGAGKEINPFKTPSSYFENLEMAIVSQTIDKKETGKGKVISLFSKKQYWISAAACIFFAFLFGVYIFTTNTENSAIASKNNEKAISVIDELYNPVQSEEKEMEEDQFLPITSELYISQSSNIQAKKVEKPNIRTVSQYGKIKSQSIEKTSDVIYSLYFDDENDSGLEEEFFL